MNERAKDFAATCHRSGCECSTCMPIKDWQKLHSGMSLGKAADTLLDAFDCSDLMQLPTSDLIASNGQAYSTDCFREYQRRLALEA